MIKHRYALLFFAVVFSIYFVFPSLSYSGTYQHPIAEDEAELEDSAVQCSPITTMNEVKKYVDAVMNLEYKDCSWNGVRRKTAIIDYLQRLNIKIKFPVFNNENEKSAIDEESKDKKADMDIAVAQFVADKFKEWIETWQKHGVKMLIGSHNDLSESYFCGVDMNYLLCESSSNCTTVLFIGYGKGTTRLFPEAWSLVLSKDTGKVFGLKEMFKNPNKALEIIVNVSKKQLREDSSYQPSITKNEIMKNNIFVPTQDGLVVGFPGTPNPNRFFCATIPLEALKTAGLNSKIWK